MLLTIYVILVVLSILVDVSIEFLKRNDQNHILGLEVELRANPLKKISAWLSRTILCFVNIPHAVIDYNSYTKMNKEERILSGAIHLELLKSIHEKQFKYVCKRKGIVIQ